MGLDYLGLVPRRDNITLMGVGAPSDRLAALLAGSVDAMSVSAGVADSGQTGLSSATRLGQGKRSVSVIGFGHFT